MAPTSLPGFVDVVAPQDLDGNPGLPEEHVLSQVLVVPQINSAAEGETGAGLSFTLTTITREPHSDVGHVGATAHVELCTSVSICTCLGLLGHVLQWATVDVGTIK